MTIVFETRTSVTGEVQRWALFTQYEGEHLRLSWNQNRFFIDAVHPDCLHHKEYGNLCGYCDGWEPQFKSLGAGWSVEAPDETEASIKRFSGRLEDELVNLVQNPLQAAIDVEDWVVALRIVMSAVEAQVQELYDNVESDDLSKLTVADHEGMKSRLWEEFYTVHYPAARAQQ